MSGRHEAARSCDRPYGKHPILPKPMPTYGPDE